MKNKVRKLYESRKLKECMCGCGKKKKVKGEGVAADLEEGRRESEFVDKDRGRGVFV